MDSLRKVFQYEVDVKHVIDGDTFVGDVYLGMDSVLRNQRFRLWAIDTPEKDEPDYQKATDYTKNAIEGKKVLVETIKDNRDKYGRWLCKVFLNEFRTLNDELVINNLARRYTA